MRERSSIAWVIRVGAVLSLFGLILFEILSSPAQGALQESVIGETHLEGPQVRYLFGSGSTTGGRRITLRVELTGPAPAGGVNVALESEEPDIIPLPDSITVEAGDTEKTFTVTTNTVTVDTYVHVSASYGRVTKGREVLIKEPDLRVLYAQSVIRGGGQGKLTVCLTGKATPGGIVVNLTNNKPDVLAVPPSVTVPEDKACQSINVPAAEVADDVAVRVTAAYDGISHFRNVIVRDFAGPAPATSTPTSTATATATGTATATSTSTATATSTSTATATSTSTATATSTATSTATATATATTAAG